MKKLTKVLSASVICLGITSISAFAYNTHTGWVLSPVFPLGVAKHSYEYNLASAYKTVVVEHAGVIFEGGWLPSGMIQEPHDFQIYLVDSDYGNDDDKLKEYLGEFDGGTLTKIVLNKVNYPLDEAIDSTGDGQAELYIEGTLSRRLSLYDYYKEDPYTGPGEEMFTFDIQVK